MNKSGTSLLVVLLATTVSCGSAASTKSDAGTTDEQPGATTSPEVPMGTPNPADFVREIDNPYLPLRPGTRWVYESTSSEGNEKVVVTVTDRTRQIQGVAATVVRDTVTTGDGALVEDTWDWFAQDKSGNVWYFGEYTESYADGKTSTEGSWEAGTDGAKAGMVMPSDPSPGDAYQQEYHKGEAEDEAKVLAVDARAKVPFGSFTDLVKTADSTPLEPDVLEHKYYAKGIGFVYEEMVRGGDDRVRLTEMTKH